LTAITFYTNIRSLFILFEKIPGKNKHKKAVIRGISRGLKKKSRKVLTPYEIFRVLLATTI